MWTGKAKDGCKLWDVIGGRQIDTIRAGTDLRGDTETPDYLRLTSPRAGWTKKSMVDWALVVAPPVEPPVEPPPADPAAITVTVTANIRLEQGGKVYAGTVDIDGVVLDEQ